MATFSTMNVEVNGSMLIELASRKKVLLESLKDRLTEQLEDLNKFNLFPDDKNELREKKEIMKLKIDNSVNFCQILIDFIKSNLTYTVSIREMNFFRNPSVIEYD